MGQKHQLLHHEILHGKDNTLLACMLLLINGIKNGKTYATLTKNFAYFGDGTERLKNHLDHLFIFKKKKCGSKSIQFRFTTRRSMVTYEIIWCLLLKRKKMLINGIISVLVSTLIWQQMYGQMTIPQWRCYHVLNIDGENAIKIMKSRSAHI